jgi:hypothetical protein
MTKPHVDSRMNKLETRPALRDCATYDELWYQINLKSREPTVREGGTEAVGETLTRRIERRPADPSCCAGYNEGR